VWYSVDTQNGTSGGFLIITYEEKFVPVTYTNASAVAQGNNLLCLSEQVYLTVSQADPRFRKYRNRHVPMAAGPGAGRDGRGGGQSDQSCMMRIASQSVS